MPEEKLSPYSPLLNSLATSKELAPLDAGEPDNTFGHELSSLTVARAFKDLKVKDQPMAQCCIAGILLLHNYLEESHEICQEIESKTGSYWHALMHRREPDFSNAKYWFRQVRNHPVWINLCPAAQELVSKHDADGATDFLKNQDEWNPFKFVDLCESALGSGIGREQLCREIQMREWQLLFDYSFYHAIGKS